MKGGSEQLSVVVASPEYHTTVSDEFSSNLYSGKTLRNAYQWVEVMKDLDCCEFRAVAAVVEHRQAVESMQFPLAERSGSLLPSVLEGREKGGN